MVLGLQTCFVCLELDIFFSVSPRAAAQIDDWEALDVGVEILDVIDKSERFPPQITFVS